MARKPRFYIVGYPYHVFLRGNNKMDIFLDEMDRKVFLKYVLEAKENCPVLIYSYALMLNHIHTILSPKEEKAISNFMHRIESRYARFFNSKYQRTGTMWEGRYKSCLIDTDAYLTTCYKYVEWNAVRAGISKHPSQYKWCSYYIRAHNINNGILDWDDKHLDFGEEERERRKKYLEIVSEPLNEKELKRIREEINKKQILGRKSFIKKISLIAGRDIVNKKRGRPRKNVPDPIF